jgi:hypothetical protein
MRPLEQLLRDLQAVTAENTKGQFTLLFSKGCELLELDDRAAAASFDTSVPNASRWRRGVVVPPAASIILKRLTRLVEAALEPA